MVKYYYDKYNVATKNTYQDTAPWVFDRTERDSLEGNRKEFTFNAATNTYDRTGGLWGTGDYLTEKSVAYNILTGGSILYRYQLPSFSGSASVGTIFDIQIYKKEASKNTFTTQDIRGLLVQSNVVAENGTYPTDGRHTDGFWYVRKGVVNTAPAIKVQIPTQSVKKNASVTLNLANYFTDAEGDPLTYTVASSNTNIATAAVLGNILTLTGKEIGGVTVTVIASDGQLTASQSFILNVTNTAPTVSVSSPSANLTLYENDIFNVAGVASDVDTNQSVTVYAQINNEQRVALAVGLSNMAISFNKQLKFIGGKLYDGDTLIAGNLTDGVQHTLKIWAQDGDGGQSVTTERVFYVVPNRPPNLTVDTVVPSGIINTDKFSISGTAGDPDGNPVTAALRINGGNSIALEIINGTWAFDLSLSQLIVGQNLIVIELVDSYNFKVSKTIKLNKNEVKTPILHSVARYKIEPPKGSAKGVLLFIERDVDLDLQVELSMTLVGEQEQYIMLTPDNTAPMQNQTGIIEDTFYYEANEQKNNIVLKLSTTRENVNINRKIHLVSGVVE